MVGYSIRIKPLRAGGHPKAVITCPSTDGYKTRAARLASAVSRNRYSHTQGGYVCTPSAAKRFEFLYSAGADACIITGAITQ